MRVKRTLNAYYREYLITDDFVFVYDFGLTTNYYLTAGRTVAFDISANRHTETIEVESIVTV
jgi:hypothetical protein